MTVKEFCAKYQITKQAAYAKIKRKSAQLDGHVTKSGGQLVIDEFAENFLAPRPPDYFLLEKNKNLQEALKRCCQWAGKFAKKSNTARTRKK